MVDIVGALSDGSVPCKFDTDVNAPALAEHMVSCSHVSTSCASNGIIMTRWSEVKCDGQTVAVRGARFWRGVPGALIAAVASCALSIPHVLVSLTLLRVPKPGPLAAISS